MFWFNKALHASLDVLRFIGDHLVWVLLLFIGGLLLGMWTSCGKPPEPSVLVRHVTTRDTVYRNVPVVREHFTQRIVYQTIPAETVLVSRPHTDSVFVRYCQATQDTTTRPLLLLSAGRYDGASLALWGPRTDGSGYHGSARLRPPFEFVVSGDSVAFSQRRVPLLRLNWGQDVVSFLLGVTVAIVAPKVVPH